MKRFAIIIMLLLCCLIQSYAVKAQKVKDVFVLVDVSGSMKYQDINTEAKKIISSMLQGNLDLSMYSGWSQVQIDGLSQECPLVSQAGTSIASSGGKVCIIPFGNMDRVKDYKFVDISDFEVSFNSSFPNSFVDKWTYITLAKAYTVNVASNHHISGMVYMIIYSDGAQESMDGKIGYSEEFRGIVDYFGTQSDSFCQKKGIIRKSRSNKDFDIEIWTLGPIPSDTKTTEPTKPTKPTKEIEISQPSKGKSPKDPFEIDLKKPISLNWKNATGVVSINIQRKKGNTYDNIFQSERKNYYILKQEGSSATITFYEPQDYKIIVTDSNMSRDERYIKAKSNLLSVIFPVILIILLAVGGVFLWNLLSKPKHNYGSGWSENNNNISQGRGNGNSNEDW